MHAPRHDLKPINRLVNLFLLLGWLLSSHGVAPAICMAAALLDGDHAVKVGVANNGSLTVVLSHEGKSITELRNHQHDALCRMLVAFAEAPASNATDHVLAFKPVDDAARAQRIVAAAATDARATAPLVKTVVYDAGKAVSWEGAAWQLRRSPWSQGRALKTGRVVMRC